MEELKCPHCQKLFQVDESGYQQIAKQVRGQEPTPDFCFGKIRRGLYGMVRN